MKLTDEQWSIVRAHVYECFPEEAVIIISADGQAIPLKNIHENPVEHFKVDTVECYKHNPIALIHSHTSPAGSTNGSYCDPRTPSAADMNTQQNMNIPFGIVSCDGDNVTDIVWFPDVDSPILGQPFIHGALDCLRVIRAFYWQEYNILLMDHPRDHLWWETGDNLYFNNYKKAGFIDIPDYEIERGDVVLMKITSIEENHGAVYLGDDKIAHHLNNRLSCEDSYSRWKGKVTRTLRYTKEKVCA